MTKKEYQLVIIQSSGSEKPIYASPNKPEVELQLQKHVRSLAPGLAEIREVKK
ncbi:MAG: hypothetical protein V3573_00010 [Desulfovibrionaceae bacterium]